MKLLTRIVYQRVLQCGFKRKPVMYDRGTRLKFIAYYKH